MSEALSMIVSVYQAGCYICVRICVTGEQITRSLLNFINFSYQLVTDNTNLGN